MGGMGGQLHGLKRRGGGQHGGGGGFRNGVSRYGIRRQRCVRNKSNQVLLCSKRFGIIECMPMFSLGRNWRITRARKLWCGVPFRFLSARPEESEKVSFYCTLGGVGANLFAHSRCI